MTENGPVDNNIDGTIIVRHAYKSRPQWPESQYYSGISEGGVELAKSTAREIYEFLAQAPEGTVLLIGGCSEMERTSSTAMVFGSELKSLSADNDEGVIVYDSSDINELVKDSYRNGIHQLLNIIEQHPTRKFVITAPLFLKGLAITGVNRWSDESENPNEFLAALLERNDNNWELALRDWLGTNGIIRGDNKSISGPTPTQIAREQLSEIRRLTAFAKRYTKNRSLITLIVGHSWNLDALILYLANNGNIDQEVFDEYGGMLDEAGAVFISVSPDNVTLIFSDQLEIPISQEVLNDN